MNVGSGCLQHRSRRSSSLLLAAAVFGLVLDLRTYQRLTNEAPAGELDLSRVAPHQYDAVLTFPNGTVAVFFLRGDEWQVDARILKWQASVDLLGFDTAFRLDRISGRYTNIEDERGQPRTVYQLHPARGLRSVGPGAPLPSLAAVGGRAVRQCHVLAHGRQGLV